MADSRDNERAALAEVRKEMPGASPAASGEPKGFVFYVVLLIGLGFAALVSLYFIPCGAQRALWFVNGAGMRSCAWEAKCSVNKGKYSHVAIGTGYMWFDKDAPAICQGVKF